MRDLYMAPGLNRLPAETQNRRQTALAVAPIELLVHALYVHVQGIHPLKKVGSRFRLDETVGDQYIPKSRATSRPCTIHNKLHTNNRFVVGVGNADVSGFRGSNLNNGLQPARRLAFLATLGYLPVLAELAAQIAAPTANAQDLAARMEVIQRLLFNGIEMQAGNTTVRQRLQLAVSCAPNPAPARLSIPHPAGVGTEITANRPVRIRVPVSCQGHAGNFVAQNVPRRKLKELTLRIPAR